MTIQFRLSAYWALGRWRKATLWVVLAVLQHGSEIVQAQSVRSGTESPECQFTWLSGIHCRGRRDCCLHVEHTCITPMVVTSERREQSPKSEYERT